MLIAGIVIAVLIILIIKGYYVIKSTVDFIDNRFHDDDDDFEYFV